jgi:hypothetical protein
MIGVPHLTYADIAVIVLTATGVIVATMAVVIGVLAIFGWRAIQSSASTKAKSVAKQAIDAHLDSDDFYGKLRDAVDESVADQIKDSITVTVQTQARGGHRGGRGASTPAPYED